MRARCRRRPATDSYPPSGAPEQRRLEPLASQGLLTDLTDVATTRGWDTKLAKADRSSVDSYQIYKGKVDFPAGLPA